MQGPEGSAGGGAAADAPPDGAAAGRGGPSRGYERTAEKASWPPVVMFDQYERMLAKASPNVLSRALGDGADMWLHALVKRGVSSPSVLSRALGDGADMLLVKEVSMPGAGSSSSPW
mmetsp:Transcript_71973/g.203250  ORF Transcript_71973/g.203250 Transcript_71973/m.203250 type:complete len:117 (+) Transcript_71973:85-435(+)